MTLWDKSTQEKTMHQFDYEKLADKLWDSETMTCVAKIHECKGRQELFVRQKPAELTRLIEYAKIESTEYSNKIEGIVTTNSRLKQIVSEKTTPRNRSEKEIAGYRDVLNTIHESHNFIPVRPSYILQLHRDLLKYTGLSYGGNFKNVQNYISETNADGTQITRFTPLPPYETPGAIEAICESYNRTISMENVDPLIVIPAFICDFLCIHPFNDGNGRMSRLLTVLLLYQNGYEVGKYISIEKQIEKTKDIYYDVLVLSDQDWNEGTNDPTPFIKYFLQIVLACYIEFEEKVKTMSGHTKRSSREIVQAYLEQKLGKITGADVITACPSLGRSTIMREMKRLVEEGYLTKFGAGKSTYYVKTSELKN